MHGNLTPRLGAGAMTRERLVGWARGARRVALLLSLVTAAALFAWQVHGHYDLRRWHVFRVLTYGLASALLAGAAALGGFALAGRLLGAPRRLREQVVVGAALGVLGFSLLVFTGGLFGLFGPAFFFAPPLALLAAAAFRGRETLRIARLVRRLRRPRPLSLLHLAGLVAAALGLAVLYLGLLTPEATTYDARWYHLGLAEHYAAERGVRRFPEGFLPAALPHLASYLYAWAWQMPRTVLYDRVLLSLHVELTLWLLTLASVSVLAARLARRPRLPLAWAFVLLFPGVFVYDSAIGAGADHVLGFWACPLWIAFARCWEDMSPRRGALLGALCAGAALTKYQAIYLLAFPVAALAARLFVEPLVALRRAPSEAAARLGRAAATCGAATAAGLALWAPHWLKNLVWYGDPLFPYLRAWFAAHPMSPDADVRVGTGGVTAGWRPEGPLGARLEATFDALYQFSFVPHDWPSFHGAWPVFGSLFTLSMLALPWLRGARRVLALAAAAHVGVGIWFWTYHQDRYLQALVPWMAACTAAVFALAWRAERAARPLLVALGGLQLLWGLDAPLIASNTMTRRSNLAVALEHLGAGYRKEFGKRLRTFEPMASVGDALPDGARLLLHELHVRTGLRVPVVSDWGAWQTGISYGRLGSSREVHDLLRGLGVTHLLWSTHSSRGEDSLAGDLRFFAYAQLHGETPRRFGSYTLAALPATPPKPPTHTEEATLLVCPGRYASGRYLLSDLTAPGTAQDPPPRVPAPRVPLGPDVPSLLRDVDFVVWEPACHDASRSLVEGRFEKLAARGRLHLFAARGGSGSPARALRMVPPVSPRSATP